MSEKITFKELIQQISERTDKDRTFTEGFMRELVEIIESGLRSSGSVTIAGFGKFELRWMDERKGINPQTSEEITIPGQNKVVFKPYKPLREHVNRTYSRMDTQILEESPDSADVPEETSEEKSAPAPITGGPGARKQQDEEELDDLIFERPSPVSEEAAEEPEEKQQDLLTTGIAGQKPLVEEVQNKGSYRWSYVAATILVMIALLAFFYFANRDDAPEQFAADDPVTETIPAPTADQLPSVSADAAEEEEVPPDIAETDATEDAAEQITAEEAEQTAEEEEAAEEAEQTTVEAEDPAAVPEAEELIETEIIISPGQTMWSIAEEQLGDPFLWPWIYHHNIDDIQNPNLIVPGEDLTVPVPVNREELNESELREVALGYADVYEWYRNQGDENARYFLWAAGSFYPDLLDEMNDRADIADLRFARNR